MEVALIIGAYVAVIGSIYYGFTLYRNLSNHVSTKLDKIERGLSNFKADTNRALGRIEGELKIMNKGGGSGGEE